MLRFASVLMAAVLGLGAVVASPSVSSADVPQITSLTLNPETFDLTTGTVWVSMTVHVVAPSANFFSFGIHVDAPGSARFWGAGLGDWARISGDATDGVYQTSFFFPRYSVVGPWDCTYSLAYWDPGEEQPTYITFTNAEASSFGWPLVLTNTGAFDDHTPPQLESFAITPGQFDSETTPVTLTLTGRATDDLAGVLSGSVYLMGTHQFLSVDLFTPSKRISGNEFDGTYQTTLEMPAWDPYDYSGIYSAQVVIYDGTHRVRSLETGELAGLGFTSFVVNGDCGNGTIEPGEACDDANGTGNDGCETNCTLTPIICGDGYQDPTEQCDDGNYENGDGCDTTCVPSACGNGVRAPLEVCDDGNLEDLDGCESDCTLSDGILDASFGTAGVAVGAQTNIGEGTYMARQADGSVVIVHGSPEGTPLYHLEVTRHAPDGSLDTSFGTSGIVTSDIGGRDTYAGGIAIQGDGKIVVACWTWYQGSFTLALQRYLPNGALDSSFGTAGVVTTSLGVARDLALDASGKIVVSGATADETLLLARFEANGSIDTSFGTNGVVTVPQVATANRFAIQADGKIVTLSAGYDNGGGIHWGEVVVSRFQSNGAPDTSFGSGGRVVYPTINSGNPPGAIAVQSDQKIVVGIDTTTSSAAGFLLIRLNVDGSPDASFHGGMSAVVDVDRRRGEYVTDVLIAPDGKITLAGSRGLGELSLVRFLPDGTPDEGFVGKPWASFALAQTHSAAADTLLLPDGKLLIAADVYPPVPGGYVLVRVLAGTCGDQRAQIADGEQCDDGNATDGDGCESDCTLSQRSELVAAGGTLSTGADASPSAPVQTSVTSPSGGTVSIGPAVDPDPIAGIEIVGMQLQIEAPDGTASEPIVIVLTVDASAMPDGVDASGLEAMRNGILIGDCIGATTIAATDPCVSSRETLAGGDARLTILTTHASLWSMGLTALSDAQQACVNELGKSAAGVAKAQGKIGADCLKAEAGGSSADAEACLELDPASKVAGSRAKVTEVSESWCTPPPPFGAASAAMAADSAEDAARSLPTDLLGADIDVSAATPNGAKCQAAVLKAMQKLLEGEAKLVLACAKAGLSSDTSPLTSGEDLAACVGNLPADPHFAKAANKLSKAVDKKCGGSPAGFLPGSCAGEDDVGLCLTHRVTCRTCQMFDGIWSLGADCDVIDNGFVEGSCE